MLEAAGLHVHTAADSAQAQALAQAQQYDLILMDIRLPGDSGITATYQLRTLPAYAQTPILAITSSAFAEDREECLRAGMNAHLAKPIAPEQLLEAVLEWLARARDLAPCAHA